jgi:NAD(P)-dependent dehydrogenase (short-subunit alcohol dehydrogenase family)
MVEAGGPEWTARYPSLRGKHVLVTGGGTGIGEHIVTALAAQKMSVSFIDIADEPSEALARRLRDEGLDVRYVSQDLTNIEQAKAKIADLIASSGPVDILVNNAANDDRHQIAEVTPAYYEKCMAVNLRHYFFCAQAVIPTMKQRGCGAIINIGSISWHVALPDLALYQTANAGIEGMTRAMARDLGPSGIRVNCVVPGGVQTPRQMALWHDAEEEARMLGEQCLKQRLLPQDVAAMVLFLASDDARMCTAHSYFIDGGWH